MRALLEVIFGKVMKQQTAVLRTNVTGSAKTGFQGKKNQRYTALLLPTSRSKEETSIDQVPTMCPNMTLVKVQLLARELPS